MTRIEAREISKVNKEESAGGKKGIYTGKCMTVEIKRERRASKSKKNTREK